MGLSREEVRKALIAALPRNNKAKPRLPKGFRVGMKVRMSDGAISNAIGPLKSTYGEVVGGSEFYPGSIKVLKDGCKQAYLYHPSYWVSVRGKLVS